MAKIKLPDDVRDIFERFGVVQAPTVPRLEEMLAVCRKRNWSVDLKLSKAATKEMPGTTRVVVVGGEQEYASSDLDEGLAFAKALAEALNDQPEQPELWGEDHDAGADSD